MPSPHVNAYYWLVTCALLTAFVLWFAQRLKKAQVPQCRYAMSAHRFPFKAGDILLNQTSLFTRILPGSTWSHVAMVYQDPWNEMLYVWETAIPVQGPWHTLTTSLKSRATRLTPLFRYLARVKKPVCVRALSKPVDAIKFSQFVRQKWDQPFGFDFLANGGNRVFQDLVGLPSLPRTDKSARFCAELIAETFAHLGVFDFKNCTDPHVRSDHIIPKDYSEQDEHLPLTPGHTFGPEILLT